MARLSFLLVIGLIFKTGLTQIPPGYYSSAQGLTGEPLRTALFNIINGHNVQSYSALWTHFALTDNDNGEVIDIYSAVPGGTASYTYDLGTDQCGNYNSESDCYNREHSVPQSWFNGAFPMYTDLFHLYPTDGYVNGQRNNWPYGEVGSANYTSSNGSMVGSCSYAGYTGTVFEPIDSFKGDLARTYFYMMTRYKNQVSGWSSPMFTGNNLAPWAEAMLLDWSLLDPVSSKEIARNDSIYTIQGNRNPFIDKPEWLPFIWGQIASTGTELPPSVQVAANREELLLINQNEGVVQVRIFNVAGQFLSESTVSNGETKVILPHRTKGMVILHLSFQNHLFALKKVH